MSVPNDKIQHSFHWIQRVNFISGLFTTLLTLFYLSHCNWAPNLVVTKEGLSSKPGMWECGPYSKSLKARTWYSIGGFGKACVFIHSFLIRSQSLNVGRSIFSARYFLHFLGKLRLAILSSWILRKLSQRSKLKTRDKMRRTLLSENKPEASKNLKPFNLCW